MDENQKKALAELEARVAASDGKSAELEAANAKLMAQANVTKAGAGSTEKKLLAKVGCAQTGIKGLMEKNIAEAGKFLPLDERMTLLELKKDIQAARLAAQIFHGDPTDREFDMNQDIPRGAKASHMFETTYAKECDLAARLKAFGTDVVGGGAEWVPTMIANNYVEEYELELAVHKVFRMINMPQDPFEQPVLKGLPVARGIAENAAGTAGTFETAVIPFKSTKLFEYYPVSEELNEDSAVDFLKVATMEVGQSQLRAYDTMLINGDITATHQDSDTTAADDARKLRDGLRKIALANSANGSTIDFAGAGITEANLDVMRAAMRKFGKNPAELAWIFSPAGYLQAQALAGVTSVDKIGPLAATILKGVLDFYRGIQIITSEYQRDDLNATGVYDGVTTDRTGILLVNHRRFYMGRRRPIRIRAVYDARAEYDRWQIVSYSRVDFKGHEQGANEVSVAYGYNALV